MTARPLLAAALAVASPVAPALADDASLPTGFAMQPRGSAAPILGTFAPPPTAPVRATAGLPALLTPQQRVTYQAVFAAIRASDWTGAAALLDAGDGPLHAVARAELILARGSPRVEADALVGALVAGPELPQAVSLARLARARGAIALPTMVAPRELVRLAGAPKRGSPRATRSDAAAAALAAAAIPLLKEDRAVEAEALLDAAADLSAEARTEWQQRIAWGHFQAGDDVSARRLGLAAQAGPGEWAVQGAWVAGLAAWRARDCDAATRAFDDVARRGRDAETTASGLYWSARADTACGRANQVQAKLRAAARLPETFYGLLGAAALGQRAPAPPPAFDLTGAEWRRVEARANLRTAVALAQTGEAGLADQLIRHQARIGDARDHELLLHLAARLDMPGTQVWLAQNGPAGTRVPLAARYPRPGGWSPQGGWRVDKALIYAHALQESRFRLDATSPAGARGLMQLMPGTVDLVAKRKGVVSERGRMIEPGFNLEYGQSYLEQLRDGSASGGLLPKVIAAYNAGPGAVARWNGRARHLADPLLFIEAIPYAETRGYVAIVLRNYWMYQRNDGVACATLKAMAQGLWPRFPGLPGKAALRVEGIGATASAH